MARPRIKRLFNSVFTRLLLTITAAGMAITFTVIAGFVVIRFHSESSFERNLLVYVDYLLGDLGDPPSEARAREIARRTGLVICFEHPTHDWQTGPIPRFFNLKRAWVRKYPSGLWMGSSKGHHFIRLVHGGGRLLFVAPMESDHAQFAIVMLVVMALTTSGILALAYFYLRRQLGPLRVLKKGVDEAGAGRLDHRIPEAGRSELRDLARAFNTMAERLSQLLHSKEQLLLDMSHELRSPITRLKVQLEFLTDDEARESLRSDVAEMESMVTAILESARMRHAAAVLNLQPTDLGQLAGSLAADFKDRLPEIHLGLLVNEPVQVDPEKIRTALRNLLDNALKHTPDDGPPVTLSMELKSEALDIVVADQGEGIPASAIPHLFEPFYRPDTSRSRKTGGYGLGLSLCKAIVDAHGGAIDLSSTPGEGTRVIVTIPRTR
ncbi:sensor histidine kinase [Desulfosarcina variabilis]|uniref:sensor histidine kinase n=1 Tax=Desulfosarcina variabilis TaxID=2300 RepID=UPI003AFB74F6